MTAVLAWALFDLANTFFAVAMLSFYFPLWVVEDRGAKELAFSLALGASMIAVAALMPFCGALSDATGRRMQFLRWSTYGCVAATAAVAFAPSLGTALVLFAFANICYQLGTVFYDALLWTVAAGGRTAGASAVGAAFGYLGSMVGLLLLWPFVRSGGHGAAFLPAAGFFLLFALPSFLLIREGRGRAVRSWALLVREAMERLGATVRRAKMERGLWRYFWATFFSLNAINTVLVFMAVYTRRVVGFTEAELIRFFVFSQAFAIAGSLSFGRVMRHWGAKRTLIAIWLGWMGALALLVLQPSVRWLWGIGPLIGFCLGSTWATARVLLLELSPKDQLAQMVGLAGLFGRLSAVLGPLLWGLIVHDPARYRHAVVLMIGFLGVGAWLLRRVPGRATA
jgi:UMF1 family MFS transporter